MKICIEAYRIIRRRSEDVLVLPLQLVQVGQLRPRTADYFLIQAG